MKQRILCMILSIAILFTYVDISVFATELKETVDTISGNDVEKEDVIEEISDASLSINSTESDNSVSDSEDIILDNSTKVQTASLETSGQCGDNLTWRIENETLTISGTGAMWDYEDTDEGKTVAPWSVYEEQLTTLVLEEGITYIGERAFEGCSCFEGKLLIPNTVTSIGSSAFQSCLGIEELVLSNNLKTIGNHAFVGCFQLKGRLEIPNGVEEIGYHAFANCTGFNGDLIIPSSVKVVGSHAFYYCSGIDGIVKIESKDILLSDRVFYGTAIDTIYGFKGTDAEEYAIAHDLQFYELDTGEVLVGSGTENDPYIISSVDELSYFMRKVNAGETFAGKCFVLDRNIYLNDISNYSQWSDEYTPALVWDGINGFAGNFDGQDYTIYGLYMKKETDNVGFFNEFNKQSEVVIKNINFENVYVSGGNNVGAVVGKADCVRIENCSVNGAVKGTGDNIGGLVGYSGSAGHYGTKIYDSINNASVNGSNYVGGFVGQAYIGNNLGLGNENVGGSEKLILQRCTNKGNVNGAGNYIGGIAGSLDRMMNCGGMEITELTNIGEVVGQDDVGGIAGLIKTYSARSEQETHLNYISNQGNVMGETYVGGIAGKALWNGGGAKVINNSYNAGDVTANNSDAGGIYGNANGGNDINLSFNVGKITAPVSVGALIGHSSGASMNNVYYLSGSAANSKNGDAKESNVKDLSNEEMKVADSFQGFDFDRIWEMGENYPIINIRYKLGGDEPNTVDEYVVQEVMKYIDTGKTYEIMNRILNLSVSGKQKIKLLTEVFSNYGITDVYEGIEFVTDINSHIRNFTYLTTNESFCAYNYYEWLMEPSPSWGFLARSSLYSNALIFNYELYAYLDIMTYVTKDEPGVKKCEKLLLDIINASETDIDDDIINSTNEITEFCDKFIELNGIVLDYEIERLRDEIRDATNTPLEQEEYKSELAELLFKKKGDGLVYFGVEGLSDAMEWSTNIMGLSLTTAEDIKSIMDLEEDLQMYNNYKRFLETVSKNVDISADMRKAASRLVDEIYNGYEVRIKKILYNLFKEYTEFDEMLDTDIIKLLPKDQGLGEDVTLGGALSTIKLATYILNLGVDIGSFVKEAFYLQGYAELSIMYSNKLLEDATNFRRYPTVENAWTFFEDYTMLWNLRYYGEKQYAELFKLKVLNVPGWKNVFEAHLGHYDEAYEETEYICKNLEECKFVVADKFQIPKGVQYVKKAVINCPVDVYVYNEQDELVAVLKDGEEMDIVNEYGRFVVVYQPSRQEYAKVICQITDENLRLELRAIDVGIVDYIEYSEGKIHSFDNVEVVKDNNIIIQNNTYGKDVNGDGNIEELYSLVESNPNENVQMQDIIVKEDYLELKIGEKRTLETKIIPENTTCTLLSWESDNTDIVDVQNGVFSAEGVGETKVRICALDNSNISKEITIKVLEATGEGKDESLNNSSDDHTTTDENNLPNILNELEVIDLRQPNEEVIITEENVLKEDTVLNDFLFKKNENLKADIFESIDNNKKAEEDEMPILEKNDSNADEESAEEIREVDTKLKDSYLYIFGVVCLGVIILAMKKRSPQKKISTKK